ncbi:MAG: HD domain-containing phosphohydrolase [Elusimicrobiota bacterium]
MNWHITSAILAGIFSFSIGLFVYQRNRQSLPNKTFFLMNISIALWNFADIFIISSQTAEQALLADRISYIGAFFIVPFFTRLNFLHTENAESPLFKRVFLYAVAGALALSALDFTPFFLISVTPNPFTEEIGPLYFLFVAYFLFFVSFSLYHLFRCYRNTNSYEKKNRLKYIFTALVIGVIAVCVYFATLVDRTIPPVHYFIEMAYLSIFAYVIVRYHAMDINIIFERSTVYAVMIAVVTTIYLATIFVIENILKEFIGYSSLVARLLAALIIALTFLPLRTRIENLIDRVFFRTRYEYLGALKNFTDRLVLILELRQLMQTIVDNISQILQVNCVSLLVFDEDAKEYRVKASVGFENVIRDVSFKHDALIVQHLKSRLKFKHQMAQKSEFFKDRTWGYPTLVDQMESLKAELFIPLFFSEKLIAILTLGDKKSGEYYNSSELRLLKTLANQAAIALSNAMSYDELKKNLLGTIEALSTAIEAKDDYTRGHSERVVKIAVEIAKEMSVSRDEIDILRYAGMLHDIGKIAIDDSILHKPSSLTRDEQRKIKDHPEIGENIIAPIKFLEDARQIIRNHHERWDGEGYPDRLVTEKIPVLSRILAVADAFDAMTSVRSYRPARCSGEAVEEIMKCAGSQFDPLVIEAFMTAHRKGNIQ